MQFRERGKKVLCIRTEYIPEKKRTIGKTIVSQNKYMSTVSDKAVELLEKEEIEAFESWLSKRDQSMHTRILETALDTGAYHIDSVAKALEEGHELATEDATKIYEAIDNLQKALRKGGHTRPKKTVKKPPVDNDQIECNF